MSEIVDRVARAIVVEYNRCNGTSAQFDDMSDHSRDVAVKTARAVLLALREPTDAMVAAAVIEPGYYEDQGVPEKDVRVVWAAMLGKALS